MKKKKNHKGFTDKIDWQFVWVALSISFLTFVIGIFIGKKLIPQDSVRDIEKQVKKDYPQDKFTFFYTLPNPKDIKEKPPAFLKEDGEAFIQKLPSGIVRQKKVKKAVFQPKGKYTIQLASFQKQRDAENLVKKLQVSGYEAYLTEADLETKGLWYRVRVGRFQVNYQAQELIKRIQMQTGLKGFLAKIK